MLDRMKTGSGICGMIYIVVAFILTFIAGLNTRVPDKTLVWNAFVLNVPVLLEFIPNFFNLPKEKVKKWFKVFCVIVIIMLLFSPLSTLLYVGMDYSIEEKNMTTLKIIDYLVQILKYSVWITPFGVLLSYICSLLIEEHRVKQKVEKSQQDKGGEIS